MLKSYLQINEIRISHVWERSFLISLIRTLKLFKQYDKWSKAIIIAAKILPDARFSFFTCSLRKVIHKTHLDQEECGVYILDSFCFLRASLYKHQTFPLPQHFQYFELFLDY